MTDYSPRGVFDVIVKETVYQKLSGALPSREGMIWLNTTDVLRHVDPEEFNRSNYSKYVLAAHLRVPLMVLEDQGWITSRGSQLAIHYSFLDFMIKKPRETVDAYIQEHLKDFCYG